MPSEDLSENGKAQLASLQFLEVQMNKLKAEIAVYQLREFLCKCAKGWLDPD